MSETQEVENTEGRNFEAEARTMGWVPPDEFKGDPEKHKPAQEFVEEGERKIPLLINNQKRLTQTVQDLTESLEFQANMHQTAMKDQNDRLRAEYEEKMQDAAKEGDEEAFLAAKKGRDDVKDPPAPQPKAAVPPEVSDFIDDNPWYQSDQAMTDVANAASQRLMREFPDLTLKQNYARAKAEVVAAFPHKFSNQNRNEPGLVSSGRKPAKSSGQTFNDLPEDAKAAFTKFHKRGVFGKDAKEEDAQKQYLSTYQWD